eukprot:Plantae.Rhodophyta-Palmaria_palmata.ctg12715.p1 GENE.Plantae.Rhodophyta-Palmaria_palmata.ctg12715~~Plantae.Rhodophyta-Palmaria_palmata.ctg12715.p1  ORF type:complete len:185 (-),score=20.32 Plantae.Rhodophyta-Palmaria_palmata.ctg12715:42-551(-)
MRSMFHNAIAFNQDLSEWDASSVTSMDLMFFDAAAFNQDLSSWNVSRVESMAWMFFRASTFNQDLSSWNVGRVTSMRRMFGFARAFEQDLTPWLPYLTHRDVLRQLSGNTMLPGTACAISDTSCLGRFMTQKSGSSITSDFYDECADVPSVLCGKKDDTYEQTLAEMFG